MLSSQINNCDADRGFQGDSLDVTLGTDDIDDVHIPQFSDDAGSQGEWDPNQATSSRALAAVPSPFTPSSPITDSLRTITADTQESYCEDAHGEPVHTDQGRPTHRPGLGMPLTLAAAPHSAPPPPSHQQLGQQHLSQRESSFQAPLQQQQQQQQQQHHPHATANMQSPAALLSNHQPHELESNLPPLSTAQHAAAAAAEAAPVTEPEAGAEHPQSSVTCSDHPAEHLCNTDTAADQPAPQQQSASVTMRLPASHKEASEGHHSRGEVSPRGVSQQGSRRPQASSLLPNGHTSSGQQLQQVSVSPQLQSQPRTSPHALCPQHVLQSHAQSQEQSHVLSQAQSHAQAHGQPPSPVQSHGPPGLQQPQGQSHVPNPGVFGDEDDSSQAPDSPTPTLQYSPGPIVACDEPAVQVGSGSQLGQVSQHFAPSQASHQRPNSQVAPQHIGQPASAPGQMPRVSPSLTQLMSGTSRVPQQSPIVSQSGMLQGLSGQHSPLTSQASSGQIHAGAGLDIHGVSIEQKRMNAIRLFQAKQLDALRNAEMHSQSQSQMLTQSYSPAQHAPQSPGSVQVQSHVPVQGFSQQSRGSCQQPLPAQSGLLPQGSSEHRLQSQGHSQQGPALAVPSTSTSLLLSQTHSQVWSRTLSPSSQIGSRLSSASGSQTQPGAQPHSQPLTPSPRLQTPLPHLQTALPHPTQPRPPHWSSPTLSPAPSQPKLAVPTQPQVLSPSVSQAAPQARSHASCLPQQVGPGLHTGLQTLMSPPEPHSQPQMQSQLQSQTQPQSQTPGHILAQLAGTGVFQGHQVQSQQQQQQPALSPSQQQHQVQFQQQAHLLPSQQQQQQQQSALAGSSSQLSGAVPADRKRSHAVMSAGQNTVSGPVDDKGVSIEAKRHAAIRRQQQKKEEAACRRLDFGQS